MKKLKSNEIRQIWLDFFKSKDHEIIESAPLVPINDPTLLWINAGVAPLKKYFDGREIPKNKRMANAQKSIRTNDIENVGKTARHHTFFEMLGNFSIGDYFRDEALTWAIEILTSPKWYGFDLQKLYFTVYPDDTSSIEKWQSLGVPKDHIILLDDNFWEIGEGPCGPDTEIFYDRGEKYDPNKLGIEMLKNDIENDRYIEIWNIVFSQYNSVLGLHRNDYPELPSKNIDTGMGLERMACVIQKVDTNYDTDLFMPIISATETIVGVKYQNQMAFKVIADHVRSVVFAVADGAVLSNEGRGYVLRRILRRAVRYGKKLGMQTPFLYRLVSVVADIMKDYYPYLLEKVDGIANLIKQEEEKFLVTLESGEKRLVDYINHAEDKLISKEASFLLYDTFGFPLELTLEVANEYGFEVDTEGFKFELEKQKQRARASRSDDQSMNSQNEEMMNFHEVSHFIGYESLEVQSKIIGLFKNQKSVKKATNEVLVVFEKTPFYGEAGGQVGDIGTVIFNNDDFPVLNTTKLPNGQNASLVDFKSHEIKLNDSVHLIVDQDFRTDVIRNHSSTHLMNEALRKIVGLHIYQQGSSVGQETFHFDFNNYSLISSEQIIAIEDLVNEHIKASHPVIIKEMPIDEAKKMNVQAVFGEKYGDIVRVVNMDFSKELCGGCHVKNTGDIKKFVILSVESKGSGIYRIEGTSGKNVEIELQKAVSNITKEIFELRAKIDDLCKKANQDNIELDCLVIPATSYIPSYRYIVNLRNELASLREQNKDLEKRFVKLKKDQFVIELDLFANQVINKNGNYLLFSKTNIPEVDLAKDLVDRLADKYGRSLIFIANVNQDRIVFICKSKINSLHAGNIVKMAAIFTNGNGGGRNDFAQAGGKDLAKVDGALNLIKEEVLKQL
ncbi:MAG: alanine--tRNA ligase [Bacilli bacterium]